MQYNTNVYKMIVKLLSWNVNENGQDGTYMMILNLQ